MLAALFIKPFDLVCIPTASSDEERVLERARRSLVADKAPAWAVIGYFSAHSLRC